MQRRAPSSSTSGCDPCCRRGPPSCSTGSSTPRSPTSAPGATSASRRCARSSDSPPAARTLLLRIPPAAGRARQSARALAPDRLELEGEDFFETIASAYDELARAEPERIRLTAAEQPPEQVLREALAAVEDLQPPFDPRD